MSCAAVPEDLGLGLVMEVALSDLCSFLYYYCLQ